jgi:hypothetical protein
MGSRVVVVLNINENIKLKDHYRVHQASLMGHILFSLYYYYLHHICQSDDGKIFMFADDTTIYTIDKSHDL